MISSLIIHMPATQSAQLQTLWIVVKRERKKRLWTYLGPGSIRVSAAGDQLTHRNAALHHLADHLQAQAPVGSCDQHVHLLRCHFLCSSTRSCCSLLGLERMFILV